MFLQDRRDRTWVPRAACRTLGSHEAMSLFYPQDCASQPAPLRAKALCAECPVATECRRYGWDEPDGVWGGLSQWERVQLKRSRSRSYGSAVVA